MNKPILALSGSLRKASTNTALLRAAQALFPDRIELANIRDVPLYDQDIEDARFPTAVTALQERLADAAGLMLVSPEYNRSVPGVLKNAVDWLSRPNGELRGLFNDLPVAVLGISPGRFGTVSAQYAWLPVLHTLGADTWSGGQLMMSGSSSAFDEHGGLAEESSAKRLERFVSDFLSYCDDRQGAV